MYKKSNQVLKARPLIKVAHLTSVHQPNDVRIFIKECRSLVNAGYEVFLLAPAEQDLTIDGIELVKVIKASSKIGRFFRTLIDLYKKAVLIDADIYHFHDPELMFVGIVLKLKGKKVIYDVHEDVPLQILNKPWIPSILRKPIALITKITEYCLSRYFDNIVAATPSIAEKFIKEKTIVLQNYPLINELSFDLALQYEVRDAVIVYAGGLTRVRGILELVDAIEIVNEQVNAKIILAGKFQDQSMIDCEEKFRNSLNVDWVGWLDRDSLKRLYGRSIVGIVTLHPAPNFIESQPIKLFEYMSASLPVIASDFPLWRHIIEGCKCGILVDPLNPQEIANAILWIVNNPTESKLMGIRGRQAVIDRYSWESESNKLLGMYEDIKKGI